MGKYYSTSIKTIHHFNEAFLKSWCFMWTKESDYISLLDGQRLEYNRGIYVCVKPGTEIDAEYLSSIYLCFVQDEVISPSNAKSFMSGILVVEDIMKYGPSLEKHSFCFYNPEVLMGESIWRYSDILCLDAGVYFDK